MSCTAEGKRVKDLQRRQQSKKAKTEPQKVRALAVTDIRSRGGDAEDELTVLGAYRMQFGQYEGQSFSWVLEHDPGYALYLWADQEKCCSGGSTNKEKEGDLGNQN